MCVPQDCLRIPVDDDSFNGEAGLQPCHVNSSKSSAACRTSTCNNIHISIMDPDYSDSEDGAEARAMAEAMGFTSFGSHKPPAKKRKFNATTDAYVDGQELASLDKGGKKGQGSGGNTIPLGKQRVIGGGTGEAPKYIGIEKTCGGGNKDEIDLGDDEEPEDGPSYLDTSLPPPIEASDNDGPQYLDSSRPPPVSEEEAKEMQTRVDALLASLDESSEQSFSTPPLPASNAPYKLPQRPPAGGTQYAASVASSSRPTQRGQRNEKWYIDYYDPNFNENPWERLEKQKGLEPLCKWPENVGRQPHLRH